MGERLVDGEGVVHEKGWDGQYHAKEGMFGKAKESDWLGNAKLDRDWLGNPKQKTNWLGTPEKGASGQPLYKSTSSSTSSSDAGGALAGMLIFGALVLVFYVLKWLIQFFVWLCRTYPKVGWSLLSAIALFGGLVYVGPSMTLDAIPSLLRDSNQSPPPIIRPQVAGVQAPSPTAALTTPTALPEFGRSGLTKLIVANTDGDGVYLRRSPRMADRLRAWPDGTVLVPTGRLADGEGRSWYEVTDPAGGSGWVPSQYTKAVH